MIKVAVWTSVGQRAVLEALAGASDLSVEVAGSAAELCAILAAAHIAVMVGAADTYSPEVALHVRASRTLRWIHLMSAGYEGVSQNGLPEHCLLTGPGEGVSASVAEHAFALLFALSRGLPQALELQSAGEWDRSFTRDIVTLSGKTLLVVGFGGIGRKVGALGKAIGMHVLGVSRTGRPDDCAHEVHPVSSLGELLGRAAAIVVALPLRTDTAVLFDRSAFQRCRPGALFVNVGRGATVDQDALLAALREGALRGAALDVMTPEPLPAANPLWHTPRLLLTPHVGGAGDAQALRRMADEFVMNIGRFQRGEPLRNLILDRKY
jgi:phosphoglycerate dehydrogenase-like enzyme